VEGRVVRDNKKRWEWKKRCGGEWGSRDGQKEGVGWGAKGDCQTTRNKLLQQPKGRISKDGGVLGGKTGFIYRQRRGGGKRGVEGGRGGTTRPLRNQNLGGGGPYLSKKNKKMKSRGVPGQNLTLETMLTCRGGFKSAKGS